MSLSLWTPLARRFCPQEKKTENNKNSTKSWATDHTSNKTYRDLLIMELVDLVLCILWWFLQTRGWFFYDQMLQHERTPPVITDGQTLSGTGRPRCASGSSSSYSSFFFGLCTGFVLGNKRTEQQSAVGIVKKHVGRQKHVGRHRLLEKHDTGQCNG